MHSTNQTKIEQTQRHDVKNKNEGQRPQGRRCAGGCRTRRISAPRARPSVGWSASRGLEPRRRSSSFARSVPPREAGEFEGARGGARLPGLAARPAERVFGPRNFAVSLGPPLRVSRALFRALCRAPRPRAAHRENAQFMETLPGTESGTSFEKRKRENAGRFRAPLFRAA